ncbi:hypothetical protein BDR26DRAFT_47941 [Obelidium mucronatum]|nr:hypothetical protein BDR26DRAFT_47941 [Obelidium mucronatum]
MTRFTALQIREMLSRGEVPPGPIVETEAEEAQPKTKATAKDLNALSCPSPAKVRHSVSVSNLKPISIANRPFTHPQVRLLQTICEQLERSGRIKPSQSAWNSPVLLAPSAFGTCLCLSVDYKNTLNKHTINDEYPTDLVDTLLNCKWEASQNLSDYSWTTQSIDASIQDLLAFTIPGKGKYTWRFTPQEKNCFQQFLQYDPNALSQSMGGGGGGGQQSKPDTPAAAFKEESFDWQAYQTSVVVQSLSVQSQEVSKPGSMAPYGTAEVVAQAAEPQSEKLLKKDAAKNRRVTFRAVDLNMGSKVENDDRDLHETATASNRSFETHKQPLPVSADVNGNFKFFRQLQNEGLPQTHDSSVPPGMNKTKVFRKIEHILEEWFLDFDIYDAVIGVKNLGTHLFDKLMVSSFIVNAMQSKRTSAVARTAKLLLELLREGCVSGTDVISCLKEIPAMKEGFDVSTDSYKQLATFYGVFMAYDEETFSLSGFRDILGPVVIENGHHGKLIAPQLLARVLTLVKILNAKNCRKKEVSQLLEFWSTEERKGGSELVSDWLEENFLC